MSRHLKLLGCLLLALPGLAAALESDRQQPIHVRADWAEMDNRSGVSTYRGNVVLDQGTLHMEADLLKVYRSNDELDRLEAEGRPVRFRQRPEGATADVEGEALQLDYRASEDRLHLRGAAWVQQGGDRFSGERIDYDIVQSRVQASGQDNGSGRVHAVIQPRTEGEKKP
ncbi:MAG: lipopolysaccharide transport periplasmic protein LptA [Pseudomonadota bacterium]